MPKKAIILTVALTLLTGLVVGQLRLVSSSRMVSVDAPAKPAADIQVAYDFYASLNDVIRTGDTSRLGEMIAPTFVDHPATSTAPGSFDSLRRYFLSLNERAPGATLSVFELSTDGALTAVQLHIEGLKEQYAADVPLVHSTSDGYELLRIEAGQVVERWGSPNLPPLIESVGKLQIGRLHQVLRAPRLERVRLAPGAGVSMKEHEGTIVHVESGVVTIGDPAPAEESSVPLDDNGGSKHAELYQTLSAAESVSITPDTSFRIVNDGEDSATFVWLSLRLVDNTPSREVTGETLVEPGVELILLAGGAPVRPGMGPFTVNVERFVSTGDAFIPVHRTAEVEILFVESGSVDVQVHKNYVITLSDRGFTSAHDSLHVAPGQGIASPHSTEVGYRAAGHEPATFWIVTVSPM